MKKPVSLTIFFIIAASLSVGQEDLSSAVSVISSFEPLQAYSIDSFDFCAKSAIQDTVDDYLANPDPSKLKPLKLPIPPGAISVEHMPAQLRVFDEIEPGKCYFRVLLVPVGYPPDQIDDKMNKLIYPARIAFSGVPGLSFAYVSQSYNINFVHVKRLVMPENNELIKRLWEPLAKPDALVFVLNTKEYVGSAIIDAIPPHAIMNGEDGAEEGEFSFEMSDLVFEHELGHLLSLGDGYKRFYPSCQIPGTELFFKNLPPVVCEAYYAATAFPRIVRAGKCDTQEVYRFADSENTIMTNMYNLVYEYQDKVQFYAFSEIQTRIMEMFVRRHLAAKCGQ